MSKFSYYLKINDSLNCEIQDEQENLFHSNITNSQFTINMCKHFANFMNNNKLQITVVYKPEKGKQNDK